MPIRKRSPRCDRCGREHRVRPRTAVTVLSRLKIQQRHHFLQSRQLCVWRQHQPRRHGQRDAQATVTRDPDGNVYPRRSTFRRAASAARQTKTTTARRSFELAPRNTTVMSKVDGLRTGANNDRLFLHAPRRLKSINAAETGRFRAALFVYLVYLRRRSERRSA